ncbi:peptide-methionine (R)-S-oxide reductase MsrB [Balneolaceae bacterium ANBcel3]|nr:peptide-methionine (R)-S-oxide reductase MsrB [Balneolaceae bacterium ANBcel3]
MNPQIIEKKLSLAQHLHEKMLPVWFDLSRFPNPHDPIDAEASQWKERLPEDVYRVLREHGTEAPYRNAYHDTKTEGVYLCRACELPLFSSAAKFDSGTGWPSFWAPVSPDRAGYAHDQTLLMPRIEVHCPRCKGHLGHVFDDGPKPTGLRYCLNSVSLLLVDKTAYDLQE